MSMPTVKVTEKNKDSRPAHPSRAAVLIGGKVLFQIAHIYLELNNDVLKGA